MKTRPFAKIALVLFLSIFLTACKAFPTIGGSKQVTLKYWGLWESANVVNLVINDYKKDHPNVNIVYEKKSVQQYRESLDSQINSGKGPDIFTFHNTWVPMLASDLSEIPSSLISASDIKKDYYPIVYNDMRNSAKKFVGLPTGIDGIGLYWNEDIFKAAGISSPPTTWQELAQDAAKLTVKGPDGSIRTAGAALGTASNVDHFSDVLGLMILQNGGDIKNPTDQRSADTLDYYTKFAKGENRVWDETQPASTTAFIGGNLAMYFAPSWRVADIKAIAPSLNFKIAPVPQLGDSNKVSWASYWATGVSIKSTSQEEAWKFVKFMEEDKNLIKVYDEASKTQQRIFGQPYPKISLANTLSSDPYVGAYITDAPYMKSFSMASRTFDSGLNDQIIKAYEDAVNKSLQGNPSTEALKVTADTIAKTLTKFTSAPPVK